MLATLLFLAATAAASLPILTLQTLSGENVVLPHDIGDEAVLVAGFTRASRAQTEAWAHRLRDDARVSQTATIYEISILDGVPAFLRGMIISQMKSGVSPPLQKQFLIVTEGVDSWKRALAASGTDDQAYIILVQRSGAIIWRGHGALAESSYQDLIRA
ncbi:MAG TPA: hypothetical protein VHX14_21540, partial [Thermoanaerobaculia bacterium]|nr:hypothetical protein [Thermoanaerobaculia bacterium]